MPTELLARDITFKDENSSNDGPSLQTKFNLTSREIVKYINNIRDHVKGMVVPSIPITEDLIINAINSMRKVRIIDTSILDGVTIEYSDGQTLTRIGNSFVVSHPRNVDSSLFRLYDSGTVLTQIETDGNLIIVKFDVIPESKPTLVIM